VDESDSAAGQMLLLGGEDANSIHLSTVHLVDLTTGACARQPDSNRACILPHRLPDGRIVCARGIDGAFGANISSAEVWGPPDQGVTDAAWTWRDLPEMSAARHGCC
jgi:hypothetical protein